MREQVQETAVILPETRPLEHRNSDEIWEEAAIRRETRTAAVTTHAAQLALLTLALGAWQAASGTLIEPFFISSPADVFKQLWEWTVDGTIFSHTVQTVKSAFLGFLIGTSAGIIGGVALATMPRVNRVLDPFIQALYALPRLALAPLLILWFGIGSLSTIVLTATIVVFFVFYSTYGGVRDVDRELIDVARVMGARKFDVFRKVVLPSATGWIFTGIKLGVPYSLHGAVVGEIIASNKGLGFVLTRSSGSFNTAGVFAILIVIGMLGMLSNAVVNRLGAHVGRWRG